ncbi:MAG: ABC transporter permease [Lachnospiraceae bacterium]|nr:ABC transporter permease [Lachnospiraceae bacterium]
MKPYSALYYVKENKGRSLLIAAMFFLTTLLLLGGNYIQSNYYYWEGIIDYTEHVIEVEASVNDEEFRDYYAIVDKLSGDPDLTVMLHSGYGEPSLDWKCTMGFMMGGYAARYNTPEDLKEAFRILGYEADLSGLRNGSLIVSRAMAANHGFTIGDIVDESEGLSGTYTLDALIDEETYAIFYVEEYPEENLMRAHVMSKTLSYPELRERILTACEGSRCKVQNSMRNEINRQFQPINLIFYSALLLLSLVIAFSVNSVIAGHYNKRMYEFGVYRAIGLTKRDVRRKCAAEIIITDLAAIAAGVAFVELFTFLMNELYYRPGGRYLPYFSWLGVIGLIASNILVLIPAILIRGRVMCKADVTEF